jgi:hypothetical protein
VIVGITHNESGALDMVTTYRGKISAGFSPGEGPNKENYPVASGYYRMLKEVTRTQRVGASQKEFVIKDWILNDPIQKALVDACKGDPKPRVVEIVCLYKTIDEMWESSLGMYSQTDGLLCKSYGQGTNARHLVFDSKGERSWEDRTFGTPPVPGCPMKDCPDYQSGKCKPMGLLKCFPVVDLTPNPYRFETRSINSIRNIESSLYKFWSLLHAAHKVKTFESGNKNIPFDGFFGARLYLVHKKAKSGGRDIFISDILPTRSFIDSVMEPIKRGLLMNQKAALRPGGAGTINLLQESAQKLLDIAPDHPEEEGPELDVADQQGIAVQFGGDPGDDVGIVTESSQNNSVEGQADTQSRKAAMEKLIDDGLKK